MTDHSHRRILAQTNAIAHEKEDPKALLNDPKYLEAWELAKKFINTPIDEITEEDLPTEWEWTNVNGYDFTPPVRDQGGCGSCFTFSFVAGLESRVQIRTGERH